jgi:vacuolar-type H+-ATPase subunit H
MFPQDPGKAEDSGVVTKTMFSGNLASSRKCLECGQLNSKMAKKCLQCKSPLQGRPCPQCSRPNHSHSTECYKCGHSLPCTATKWVYVGSSSNKIYRSHESNSSSRLVTGLKNRAARVCLRCHRLRNSGQFSCGRCGDMYWVKPIVGGASGGDVTDTPTSGSQGQSKKKKAGLEPNWNIPSEPDPEDLVLFAGNLLCLGVGEELLSLASGAEARARETVHQAEEELEGLEEEYQAAARRRGEKEEVLSDARAELNALIAEVECNTRRLSQLKKDEENAKSVTSSHPDTVNQLREKIECALSVLTVPKPQVTGSACETSAAENPTNGERMDTTQ